MQFVMPLLVLFSIAIITGNPNSNVRATQLVPSSSSLPQSLGSTATPTFAGLTLNGKITTYNSITTAGGGLPYIVAQNQANGLTAAATNQISYSPGGSAGLFGIVGVINVKSWATPASFTVVVVYKDDAGTTTTETLGLVRGSTGATAAAITAVDRWYFRLPTFAIDSSNTAITVSTTGTFTGTPVYTFAASVEKL